MTQGLSKELMAICIRNGAEIWLEKEKVDELMLRLETLKEHKFVRLPTNEMINTADIVGMLKATTMEALIRRKNGQWQGKDGKWYNKGDKVCSTCGNVVPFNKECGYCK